MDTPLNPEDRASALAKVKSDALKLLSFSPRSVGEMRERLLKKRHDEALVDEAIASMRRQGFLNDELYAKLYAGARANATPSGRKKLAFDLKRKGVEPKLIDQALGSLEGYDEKEAARKLVESRLRRLAGVPPQKAKARLVGFLKRRGFSGDVIFSVLDKAFKSGIGEIGDE